jgi:hypothetical protein
MTDESERERRLRDRLEKLRQEFDQGQSQLMQAEARVRELRETLLRISGAIQVLGEEFGEG